MGDHSHRQLRRLKHSATPTVLNGDLGIGSLGAEERRGRPGEKRTAEGTLHSGINEHRSCPPTLHRGREHPQPGPEELDSDKHSLQGRTGTPDNVD